METRKIPFHNYIILGCVVIFTFFLLYCIMHYYIEHREYKEHLNTRMGFLSQIQENELKNYILDNHEAIIYISDSADENYKVFEVQLKNLILEESLTKDMIYLDMHKVSNNFFTDIKDELMDNNLHGFQIVYPNVLTISNGAITSVLYLQNQERNPKDVIEYVKEILDNE